MGWAQSQKGGTPPPLHSTSLTELGRLRLSLGRQFLDSAGFADAGLTNQHEQLSLTG